MDRNFTVINGNKDETIYSRCHRTLAYHDLWLRQYQSAVNKAIENNKGKEVPEYKQHDLMKIALCGIKYINWLIRVNRETAKLDHGYCRTLEEVQQLFNLIDMLFSIIGCLKLKNLIITFPIEKDFKGHEWECKDYFYTMETLSKMNMDKPIGRNAVSELLWDYQNDDLRNVYIEYMTVTSALYRLQTSKGLMEQWADENNIHTYSYNEHYGIMRNNQTGEICKVRKKSNLHVVK